MPMRTPRRKLVKKGARVRRFTYLMGVAGLLAAVVVAQPAIVRPSGAAGAVWCPAATSLGKLPGWPVGSVVTIRINDAGQIAAEFMPTSSGAVLRAFVWDRGRATMLGTLGGRSTRVAAIDQRGRIIGMSQTERGSYEAFLWQAGKLTSLGRLGGVSWVPVAINGRGQIVGYSNGLARRRVVLWQNGRLADLGSFGGVPDGSDLEIDDAGRIVGSRTTATGARRAVLWQHGKLTELGLPDDTWSVPVGIDAAGRVAGYGTVPGGETHAWIWNRGKLTDLGALERVSAATAVNAKGDVAGYSQTNDDAEHAVVWQAGRIVDLGTLRADLFSQAQALNNRGQIVGVSSASRFGTAHPVLWTLRATSGKCPVVKPFTPAETVVVKPMSIKVVGAVAALEADDGRAVVVVPRHGVCADAFGWDRAKRRIVTVLDSRRCVVMAAMEGYGPIALTGDHAAYLYRTGGNLLETYVVAVSLGTGRTSQIASSIADGQGAYGASVHDPRGHDGLLVYSERTRCREEPGGDPPCPVGFPDTSVVSDAIHLAMPARRVIARSTDELPVLAVGGGRVVALVHTGEVIVLAPQVARAPLVAHGGFKAERLVATYRYPPGAVLGAATDGRSLAVLRDGALDVVPLPGRAGKRRTVGLPHAPRLADLDGGLAVLLRTGAVDVLDVATGRRATVARTATGVPLAQLEPDGLYVASGSTVTFTPRSAIGRLLHR
jgi:probable HAF family extracellular repeat protein